MKLESLIEVLLKNQKVMGLVNLMNPLDLLDVVSRQLDLCNSDAQKVVSNLLMHANHEGLASPSIETNKQYPVPSQIRRDNEKMDEDYINNLGALVPTIKRYYFPPDHRGEVGDWPYDDMTKAGMDVHAKAKKRPLMQGPFDPDLRKNQPGGDAGAKGIYSKNAPHNRDNSTSSSGRSWDRKGTPGWSSSPQGKEFDLPDDDDIDNVFGNPPVGTSIPKFFGGRSPKSGNKNTWIQ